MKCNAAPDLREDMDKILHAAQVIRINQTQMSTEYKWPADCLERCEKAWNEINKICEWWTKFAPEANSPLQATKPTLSTDEKALDKAIGEMWLLVRGKVDQLFDEQAFQHTPNCQSIVDALQCMLYSISVMEAAR